MNLEKATYFWSLCLVQWINENLTCYSHAKTSCFLILCGKKVFCSRKWWPGWHPLTRPPPPPFSKGLIYQSFEDARVTKGYENAINIPEYVDLCLNMPEYVLICLKYWNVWRLLPMHWTLRQPWKVNRSM